MQYECPNCGSPLKFSSKLSVYTLCTQCTSMVVRHDMDLELLGKQGELLEDMSPFQVGTTGVYEGIDFFFLGRIKIMWNGGFWNEWFIMLGDGRPAWISEAQGFFMISFPVTLKSNPPDKKSLKIGKSITVLGGKYMVDDLKSITYLAFEGELPFIFVPGKKGYSVDLRGKEGEFLNFLFLGKETQVYKGEYLPFDKFNFQNLKAIDGWKIQ